MQPHLLVAYIAMYGFWLIAARSYLRYRYDIAVKPAGRGAIAGLLGLNVLIWLLSGGGNLLIGVAVALLAVVLAYAFLHPGEQDIAVPREQHATSFWFSIACAITVTVVLAWVTARSSA